jgi:hypothetical protein
MSSLPVHTTSASGSDTEHKAASSTAAANLFRPLQQCWGNAGVLPASATEAWICYVALAVFLPATLLIKALGVSLEWRLVLTAAVPATVVLALEAVYCKASKQC